MTDEYRHWCELAREAASAAEGAIRPDSAILLLSLARPELETCKGFKKDSLLASLLDELGKKLLHGKPVDSELYSRQALMIRKQLFGDSLHKDVLRMYYNIGSAHLLRKNYHQAISYFDSASVRPIAELPQLFVYRGVKKNFSLSLDEFFHILLEPVHPLRLLQDVKQDGIS